MSRTIVILASIAALVTTSIPSAGALIENQFIERAFIDDDTIRNSRLNRVLVVDSDIEDSTVSNATIRRSSIEGATLYGLTIVDTSTSKAWIERAFISGGSVTDATIHNSTLARGVTLTRVALCNVELRDEDRYDNSGCGPDVGASPTPPPSTPPGDALVLSNGGAGPGFDVNNMRGKVFNDARSGVVTQVCVYGSRAGDVVEFAVKERPDSSSPQFRDSIRLRADRDWTCEDMRHRFDGDSLFIYKTGGNGAVGYDAERPHDSRWSSDGGDSWRSDSWRRGYRVVIE